MNESPKPKFYRFLPGFCRRGMRCASLVIMVSGLMTLSCSVKKYAINQLGNALAGSGTVFASDPDPELIRDAVPFSLKLIESLLAESPRHKGLLEAACKGFTQYSYAFVQQDADEWEDRDFQLSLKTRNRARGLYLRGRDYGLRALEIEYQGLGSELMQNPLQAVQRVRKKSAVSLLYWTAAAWGAAVSVSKDRPELVADQPQVEALIDRALELDETFESGAVHTFLISYEPSRVGAAAGAADRSQVHFQRAMELTRGFSAAPLVSYAETICVAEQDRTKFVELLNKALAVDVNKVPEWRLANLVMQRRALWLLGRMDELFLEE